MRTNLCLPIAAALMLVTLAPLASASLDATVTVGTDRSASCGIVNVALSDYVPGLPVDAEVGPTCDELLTLSASIRGIDARCAPQEYPVSYHTVSIDNECGLWLDVVL